MPSKGPGRRRRGRPLGSSLLRGSMDSIVPAASVPVKAEGKLTEYYSVSINAAFRITIDFLIRDKTIIPIDIGKHEDV